MVWYSGGDATEYWSDEWSLAHGLLPHTFLGIGVPALYAWVPMVAGATLLAGLPPIVLLQMLVGVPLAVLGVWGSPTAWPGASPGGRRSSGSSGRCSFLQGIRPDYRPEFKANFLVPHWYGLTNMGDFPSIVLVLWAAWASAGRSTRGALADAVLAGALVGALSP